MSTVLSLRLPDESIRKLDRFARRVGNKMTRSRAAMLLLEEGIRQTAHAGIEFRDSPVGRQAYVKGSTLAVWEVIMVAQDLDMDPAYVAEHLEWPRAQVDSAFAYYSAFPEDIDYAIADNDCTYEELKARLPGLELHEVKMPVE
jgi:uncharacterized protein (DUF433 family)